MVISDDEAVLYISVGVLELVFVEMTVCLLLFLFIFLFLLLLRRMPLLLVRKALVYRNPPVSNTRNVYKMMAFIMMMMMMMLMMMMS